MVLGDERKAREIALFRQGKFRDVKLAKQQAAKLENMFEQMARGRDQVARADRQGRRAGLVRGADAGADQAVDRRGQGQHRPRGVGGITESDVNLALASKAVIIGFNTRADVAARKLAEHSGVDIRYYNIIYDAVDEVKAALSGMLAPEKKESQTGPGRGAAGLPDLEGRHRRRLLRPRGLDQARLARARAARQRRDPRRRARFAQALQGRRARGQGAASSAACRSRTSTTSRRATSSRSTRSSRSRGRCSEARRDSANRSGRSRVADQIQRELSEILRDELKDPRVGLVTITGVEVSADLSHAKVFFTHLAGRAEARGGRARAAAHRRLPAQPSWRSACRLYSVPQLHFAYDDSIESGMKLSQPDRRRGRRRPQDAARDREPPAAAAAPPGRRRAAARQAARPHLERGAAAGAAAVPRREGRPHRHARSARLRPAADAASARRPSSRSRCSMRDKEYAGDDRASARDDDRRRRGGGRRDGRRSRSRAPTSSRAARASRATSRRCRRAYSALKFEGRPLYEYARAGQRDAARRRAR